MINEKRTAGGEEEDAYRQLTTKNNLKLISPTLTSGSAKVKDAEEGTLTALYGSAVELARAASKRSNRMQLTMSILANLTVLSSGMGLGYSAITLHSLTRADDPLRLNSEQASWFASINSIACPFGGLISGYLLDRIGRKWTLVLINILSILSWSLIATSSSSNFELMYTQILIARVVIGLVIGLVSAPASIYSAEIATPRMRGRLTVLTSLAIAVGILMIYTFGYFIPENFRLVAAIAAGCCVLSLLLLIPLPESPAWLMSKDREPEAERSLKKIRGFGSCAKTIPLGVIIGFFGFQQFSGIFVVIVYAAKVSSEASVSIDPFLCTVMIGVTRVIATMAVAYVLDVLGRKPPSIFSGVGMAACMFGIAACIFHPPAENLSWLPTFLIITYIFTSTLGFLTMPFSMLAELFPQKVRGPASGVTVFFTYLMSFVIIKLYPSMVESIGSANVFVFYGAVSLLGVLYVCYVVPETKGKSLQEIEDYFRGKSLTRRSSQSADDDSADLSSSTE